MITFSDENWCMIRAKLDSLGKRESEQKRGLQARITS